MQENTKEKKIVNNKVDDLYNIWLGTRPALGTPPARFYLARPEVRETRLNL